MTDSNPDLSNDERELVEHLTEVEEDLDVICRAVPKMGVCALHAFCCNYNFDSDLKPLHLALTLSQCDRGTALAIYWLCEPDEWAGRHSVDESEQAAFELFQAAERRLLENDFTNRMIDIDVRETIGGVDSYWMTVAENDSIPAELKPPSGKPTGSSGVGASTENLVELFLGSTLEAIDVSGRDVSCRFSNGYRIEIASFLDDWEEDCRDEGIECDIEQHPAIGQQVTHIQPNFPDFVVILFENDSEITRADVRYRGPSEV